MDRDIRESCKRAGKGNEHFIFRLYGDNRARRRATFNETSSLPLEIRERRRAVNVERAMKSTIRESSSSETLDGTREDGEAKRKFRCRESMSRPWTKKKKRKTRVSRNRIRNRKIRGYIRFVGGLVSEREFSTG